MYARFLILAASAVWLAACAALDAPSTRTEAQAVQPVPSATAAPYFEGRKVTLLVGFPERGGSAIIARALAEHMARHIPGEPEVTVAYMPGAGGRRAHNYLFGRAQLDGTYVLFGTFIAFSQILVTRGVNFKLEDFTVIGGARRPPPVMLMRTGAVPGGATKPTDILKAEKLDCAALLPDQTVSLLGRSSLDLLGVNYRFEYRSYLRQLRKKFDPLLIFKSVMNGEADLAVQSHLSYRKFFEPTLVKSGKVIGLWTWPVKDARGNFVKSPYVPELPTFLEVYRRVRGEAPSGRNWDLLKLVLDLKVDITHVLLGPPGMNRQAAAALTTGFYMTLRDPAFMEKMSGGKSPMTPVPHERVAKVVAGIPEIDAGLIAFARDYVAAAK